MRVPTSRSTMLLTTSASEAMDIGGWMSVNILPGAFDLSSAFADSEPAWLDGMASHTPLPSRIGMVVLLKHWKAGAGPRLGRSEGR